MIALLLAGATPPGPDRPLVVTQPTADRGTVRTGPPLTHTFELTHAGTAGRVVITGVRSGCGCLKPAVARDALSPGERTTVTVAVNTLTQPAGPHAWRTVVRYRVVADAGPAPPPVAADEELTLTVTATLVREVTATPPELAFSTAGTASQTVVVSDPRPAPLTVTAAATTSPHLTAAVGPRVPAADGKPATQPVTITLAPDCPVGELEQTVVLTTSDPGCPELRIPVKVHKRAASAVAASPAEPVVRFAAGQEEASALIQLRRPDGGPVRVEKAEAGAPALRLRWATVAGPVATLRVTVDAAKGGAAGHGTVRVTFAEPAGVVLELPVAWRQP
ncbi:MAG: DUF1573 domain-containing protein [Gemmataceae bacterium]